MLQENNFWDSSEPGRYKICNERSPRVFTLWLLNT